MNETMQVITACTTAVLLLAILIGGPVACSVRAKEEATKLALGVCAGDDCRWAYLDVSRRQDRRWCSSADCGNRDRARRHYQATQGR